ncbi:MAG: calcineurin-like phosphoesterase C-terminal domain-containing protein [Prevotella sp.]|nr:calcineurin-like phosphoesterase C-terminal domain-containing protein [Prevotella sp.]
MDNKRRTQYFILTMIGAVTMLVMSVASMVSQAAEKHVETIADSTLRQDALALALKEAEAVEEQIRYERDSIRGTLTDTAGVAMPDVVVSDGFACTLTDSLGRYALHRHKGARFVYYTVPDYCEVPTHADDDRTADFYRALSDTDSIYDFTLTRLPQGKETRYRMIVIGDPQVTNAFSPYYTGPNDNPIKKSDLARFTDETMADIRRTIAELPEGTPVYGLSMGDDVQYYGGYNDSLEHGIRRALGSSEMRLFSVIGNHDQDGKRVYKEKWEENWGPTDYSFDRGDVHYVCFNNCDFYHGGLYYSPGELSDTQMAWLTQDLALADKEKKVVLCYHIPLTFGNRPKDGARGLDIPTEEGHYSSSRLSALMLMLENFAGGYELFCGHTHFALNHEIDYEGHHIMEHCHAAACGNIWQSNINICGTPNGYYVYSFDGTQMTNAYYKGTEWKRTQQMTLFRADTNFNHESYAEDWNLPRKRGVLVANVFNADSRWRVVAMENGREYPMTRLSSIGQDAFATGYHHKYSKSVSYWFVSKKNTYLIMNHLYYYEPRSPHSVIFVKAIDPYGNTYTESSSHVMTQPFFNYAHYYAP